MLYLISVQGKTLRLCYAPYIQHVREVMSVLTTCAGLMFCHSFKGNLNAMYLAVVLMFLLYMSYLAIVN